MENENEVVQKKKPGRPKVNITYSASELEEAIRKIVREEVRIGNSQLYKGLWLQLEREFKELHKALQDK